MSSDNYQVVPSPVRGNFPTILIPIIVLIVILGILFSMTIVNIGGNEVGLLEKRFGGKNLPAGRLIAANGEKGLQAKIIAPGVHVIIPGMFKVSKVTVTEIPSGKIGLIYCTDGMPLPADAIYAPQWSDTQDMLKAEYFLTEGGGFKGPQLSVLKPGKYRLNTNLYKIKQVPVTNITIGTVGVVKSNVGEIVESTDRLVKKGQRGVWDQPFTAGKYYLNIEAYEVTIINTRQQKVSYTQQMEQGESKTQPLRPIQVRSQDGFTFPVDVRITYRIEPENAPRIVANVGDDELILQKLVTPSVRAFFRNSAEKVKALMFVQNRSGQEEESQQMISKDLEVYGVNVLAVRIGDVGDEQSLGTLLKTQTDREIALQEQETFAEQQRAAETQKALSKTTQEGEEEKRLATAAYGVKVAEEDKKKLIIGAEAQAEQLKIVAEARALAYKLIADVIGSNNAALIELMKVVSENNIRITPDVMVGTSSGGATDALMGTIMKDMINKKNQQ